jgi:hypothetical protein
LPRIGEISRMLRPAFLATILIAATACDKAKELANAATAGRGAEAAEAPPAERLNLSKKPDILFQIFGEKDDPRMIPIAALVGGKLKQIVLSGPGWRQFDAMYQRSGATYSVYRDGRRVGAVRVKQGMWEVPDQPLYSLPSCQQLTPLASVTTSGDVGAGFSVELVASTARLGGVRGKGMSPAQASATARAVGRSVAAANAISADALDSLDFRGLAIATGATAEPTIVASFIASNAEERANSDGTTTHVFAIADRTAAGYEATYMHAVKGAAASAEYRRYVDHLDLTGDGVDEIFLEGWQYGGDTQLLVLSYRSGHWTEIFRGRSNWCLDGRR